nr:MAG TPA: hypothetical protein [Bacteriophage sp.]
MLKVQTSNTVLFLYLSVDLFKVIGYTIYVFSRKP